MHTEGGDPRSDIQAPSAVPREYNLAASKWLTRTYQELSRVLHPILGEVGRVALQDLPEPEDDSSKPLDAPSEPQAASSPDSDRSSLLYRGIRLQSEWVTSIDEVLNFDVDNFLSNVNGMADEMGGQLEKAIFEHISTICKSTGNQVDANGRDFYDTVIATAESMELSFDADGNLLTKIWTDEEQFNGLTDKPPTAEQVARLNAVIERKREDWDAARRRRQLP